MAREPGLQKNLPGKDFRPNQKMGEHEYQSTKTFPSSPVGVIKDTTKATAAVCADYPGAKK